MNAIINSLGERVHGWTHPSGLRVRVVSKPVCSRTHAALAVRFGSIDAVLADTQGSRALPGGIAHFLEHQMFESEEGDIAERFARLGAAANASTSFANTQYVFDTSKNVRECIDLLLELVRRPYFSEESVAKERAVIAREIRMFDDDPGARQFQNLLRGLYRDHPVRTPIVGTEASIAEIDSDLLMRTHETFYGPSRLSLAVVGNIDPEVVRDRVDRAFAAEPHAAAIRDFAFPPADDDVVAAEEVRVELDVARVKWMFAIKDREPPHDGRDRIRREVETWLLLDALFSSSAPAHEAWLRSGVIDDAFGFDYVSEPSFSFVAIAAEIDSAPETGVAPEIESAVRAEMRRALEFGIDGADFERVRRKHVGRFVAGFDQIESLAASFAEPAFFDLTPFDWLDALESICPSDLDRRARELFRSPITARSFVLPRRGA